MNTLNLSAKCTLERIPYQTSNEIPRSSSFKPAQPRALKALELAINIDDIGYNIYVAGEAHLGRNYFVKEFLKPYAKKKASPPDLIFVNNFEDQDKPRLLKVPAGVGRTLKAQMAKTVQAIRKELSAQFESDAYIKKRSALLDDFNYERAISMKEMSNLAEKQGFLLDFEEKTSLTLVPVIDGKKVSEIEFESLDEKVKDEFKGRSDSLMNEMTALVRHITKAEALTRESEKKLDKSIMQDVLNRLFKPFATKICNSLTKHDFKNNDLNNFLTLVQEDMLENYEMFLPKEVNQAIHSEAIFPIVHEVEILRYAINLFVDNSECKGAPIISEANPITHNLLGCIEREAEMGVLITDFTLIKAGSLHKASGGYLIIHIEDILQHPNAWEGLLRTMRSGFSRISENVESVDACKTKGIEPEAIPLDVKIILIGSDNHYENLLLHDDRFVKFFKIKAQLSETTQRNSPNIKAWLQNLAVIIDNASLLPFTNCALAQLVDYSSCLCEDQRKLSLQFSIVREVMMEASTYAKMQNKEIVDQEIILHTINERVSRKSYLKELYFEDYNRESVKIQTSGYVVGQVNALSVTQHGDYHFGLAHKVACTISVGHNGIIDLEREAELSGPVHIKAMMILKSYLNAQFARNKPLVFNGTIGFEQSYSHIDGDSASGAELAALLSALSEVPINLAIAFTGAVNQQGDILAVGEVTKKIEGFYDLCSYRGLTGEHGVIIPFDNKDNLMLNKCVQDAVMDGLFHIYPIKHITQALQILTGIPVGKIRKDNAFTTNSIYDKIDKRLMALGWYAENAYKKKPRNINNL